MVSNLVLSCGGSPAKPGMGDAWRKTEERSDEYQRLLAPQSYLSTQRKTLKSWETAWNASVTKTALGRLMKCAAIFRGGFSLAVRLLG